MYLSRGSGYSTPALALTKGDLGALTYSLAGWLQYWVVLEGGLGETWSDLLGRVADGHAHLCCCAG